MEDLISMLKIIGKNTDMEYLSVGQQPREEPPKREPVELKMNSKGIYTPNGEEEPEVEIKEIVHHKDPTKLEPYECGASHEEINRKEDRHIIGIVGAGRCVSNEMILKVIKDRNDEKK